MPQNTQPGAAGVPIEFQNPTTPALVLDSESAGVDATTGLPLEREVVIPTDSVSGQTAAEILLPILRAMLTELKAIRMLTEAGAVPGTSDISDEVGDVFGDDEPESDMEES